MENSGLLTKKSTDVDPIETAISSLMSVMKADFGVRFESAFRSREDVDVYKARLRAKLVGKNPVDIFDGYEKAVESKPGNVPFIPELIDAILKCEKARLKHLANVHEAEQIALIPPKPDMPDSVSKENLRKRAMLQLAAKDMGRPETQEERKARLIRLEEKRIANEKLIQAMNQQDKPSVLPTSHKCSVGWCHEIGTMSHSTNGTGSWYCWKHFQEKA